MRIKTRLLFGALVGLAMVLGLVPGTSLTAYADVTTYDLWVGNTRVTSENMGNVLGDGTVSFTPANGDTPATLTLNGANITTMGQDNSLICCSLHSGGSELEPLVFHPLNIVLSGTNNVSNSDTGTGIYCYGPVTISGSGSLTTHARYYGILSERGIEIKSGTIDAQCTDGGSWYAIADFSTVKISGGTVTATATNGYSGGIYGREAIDISGGEVTAIGLGGGIYGTVKNSIPGTGWTDTAGTEGETAIEASEAGRSLANYKKVHFLAPHTHSFTYSADGATITATCSADGCALPPSSEGGSDHVATLAIAAPTLATYGGTGDAAATLDGADAFNAATGLGVSADSVKYYAATRDGEALAAAPTGAGDYVAELTLAGVKTGEGTTGDVTASVGYTIAKAATTVTIPPTAGDITYGQTLADSALTGGKASVEGTFAWRDPKVAPAVADSDGTKYDVVFTPSDANYATVTCKVTLTVGRADISKAKVALARASYAYDGKAKESKVRSVALNGVALKAGKDFSVSYKGNVKVGTATATIRGKGNYQGTAKATFSIVPAKVTGLTTAGHPAKGTLDVAWEAAAGAKTYQLSWRKAGGKWKTKTVKGTSATVEGLRAGGCYEVRVRAKAGSATGAWSKVAGRWMRKVSSIKAAAGKTAGTIRVSWAKDAQATGGYVAYACAKKEGEVLARKAVSAGKTSATLTGLDSGKAYYVKVRPLREVSGTTYVGVVRYCKSTVKAK